MEVDLAVLDSLSEHIAGLQQKQQQLQQFSTHIAAMEQFSDEEKRAVSARCDSIQSEIVSDTEKLRRLVASYKDVVTSMNDIIMHRENTLSEMKSLLSTEPELSDMFKKNHARLVAQQQKFNQSLGLNSSSG